MMVKRLCPQNALQMLSLEASPRTIHTPSIEFTFI